MRLVQLWCMIWGWLVQSGAISNPVCAVISGYPNWGCSIRIESVLG